MVGLAMSVPTIDMPMNEWSRPRLESGRKTATTRTSKKGNPGDYFETDGMVYQLTHVVRVPLSVVAMYFYQEEGVDTPDEFVEIWEDIHYRRGFEQDWEVWLHLFRKVGAESDVEIG
jgi:hypothetical protein